MRLLLVGIVACVLLSPLAAAMPAPARNPVSPIARTPVALDGNISIYEDVIDQSQTTNYSGIMPFGADPWIDGSINISVAQSFTPQYPILTRVAMYLARNSTATNPCYLSIRDNLTGPNLAIASLSPDAFPDLVNITWVEFDFLDIPVSTNATYYMVLYTANVTDNFYFAAGSDGNPYPYGDAYVSYNDGQNWSLLGDQGDAAFKTYGRQIPSWANGMYSGYWGLNIAGMPLVPLGWFTGFSRQKILLNFDGIFAPFNTSIPNATMALTGLIIGPFLLGAVRNLTTDKAAWCVGLGGINTTTNIFLIRLMLFVGPTFFLAGKYYSV